jgi:TolB-like protein/Tfp pilus assembly protein PilF
MDLVRFLGELKRRNVYKVAVAYVVVAWLLIQVATQTFPVFEIPNWVARAVIVILCLGFPLALVLAWAFDLTPEGLQRADPAVQAPAPSASRAWIYVAGFGALLSLALFLAGRYTATPMHGEADGVLSPKSIAVLPFENLSADDSNAYFAAGMQDEIITRLAKIGDLRVISRSSTLRYKAMPQDPSTIARELGVATFLEGSVQKVGDHVRINVQLIRAGGNDHLWAEIYDRELADVFAVQSEVATAIASALNLKLSDRERSGVTQQPTDDLAAYDAYLRGLNAQAHDSGAFEGDLSAADEFEEAVRLDPQFTQAWAALARVNASVYFLQVDARAHRAERARTAAEAATRLDPAAPETLLANAYYRYHVLRDYEGARVLFESLRERVPSSIEAVTALARIARRQTRWKDSIALFEEATALNPRDIELLTDRCWTFSMLRDRASAHEMLERALRIDPDNAELLAEKARLLQWEGNLPAAKELIDRLVSEQQTESVDDLLVNHLFLSRSYEEAERALLEQISSGSLRTDFAEASARHFLGVLQTLEGRQDDARRNFLQAKAELETIQREQPTNPFVAILLGYTEGRLGNKEAALRAGERAVSLPTAMDDPVYGPIIEEQLAGIEASVGEPDRAIAKIERLLTKPYGAYPLTQAGLRLDPLWDALRGDPRFEAIVNGPEPKTIYE